MYVDPDGMSVWDVLGRSIVIGVAALFGAIAGGASGGLIELLFRQNAFIGPFIDIAVTLYQEDRSKAGQEAIATVIKNRYNTGKYSSYYAVVAEGNGAQFHGFKDGWRLIRTQKIEFWSLVSAFSIAFKLLAGTSIKNHGLTSDYYFFVAKGAGCSLGAPASKKTVGNSDFYKAKSGRFP